LVLIELKRSDEAIEHLDSIAGRIPPRDEIDALYQAATAMTSLGEAALADTWISRRLTAEPDQQALYQLLFKIRRSVDDLNGCRQVHELWRTQFGQTDPEMVRAIEEMAAGATNPTGQ
jgi:hypothetical protein